MNVYDFVGTIYPMDCTIGFCLWCMKRHPKLWLTFIPKAIKNFILRKTGRMTEATMQREFFGYLTLIDDFDEQIERYPCALIGGVGILLYSIFQDSAYFDCVPAYI